MLIVSTDNSEVLVRKKSELMAFVTLIFISKLQATLKTLPIAWYSFVNKIDEDKDDRLFPNNSGANL